MGIAMVNGYFMVSLFCIFSRMSDCVLGDRKHLNEAKKNAQDFYKDLPVTIEDVHHK
jgi:hypothetical protein